MATGDLVHRGYGRWVLTAPAACAQGHRLVAHSHTVGHQPCPCGRGGHTSWWCHTCDTPTYYPPLDSCCRLLHGAAAVR